MHLSSVNAVFILGSTEPHYTPSKTYQGVLSERPIFAVLHENSTAANVIVSTGAGQVLGFNGAEEIYIIENLFVDEIDKFLTFANQFNIQSVNQESFDEYSANAITGKLVEFLNLIVH
jgi:hypothetical protein